MELRIGVVNRTVHKDGTHLPEFLALKRFRENVRPHFIRRAVLEVNITIVVAVGDEEIFRADMFAPM